MIALSGSFFHKLGRAQFYLGNVVLLLGKLAHGELLSSVGAVFSQVGCFGSGVVVHGNQSCIHLYAKKMQQFQERQKESPTTLKDVLSKGSKQPVRITRNR